MTRTCPVMQDPVRQCRPFDRWSTVDQAAWVAARQAGDVLDPGAPASRWAVATTTGALAGYGRWLTWLDQTGQLDLAAPPAGQVTPKRVGAFITALQALNAPNTVLHRITNLARAAAALAPDIDWRWLCRIAWRLERTATPVRLKHLRVVGAEELFGLGRQLMREAEQGASRADWRQAMQYRDGLMIALLAARPLRMKNFTVIEIGRHLVTQGGHTRLVLSRNEPKTRLALDLPFPALLCASLERYLSHYRPILCSRAVRYRPEQRPRIDPQAASVRLWISARGRPMRGNGIYDRITRLTRTRLGHAVNPHLFRDCAATSIALDDPKHVHITPSVLGHTRITTSERSYNHAPALKATRSYQDQIMTLRRASSRVPREA